MNTADDKNLDEETRSIIRQRNQILGIELLIMLILLIIAYFAVERYLPYPFPESNTTTTEYQGVFKTPLEAH